MNQCKSRVFDCIREGITGYARKKAFNQEQFEEFFQEGMTTAFEVIDRYSDKSDDELIRIVSKCAYNKISDLQRSIVSFGRKFNSQVLEETLADSDNEYEDFENREFIKMLSKVLSEREHKIIESMLNYDNLKDTRTKIMQEREEKRNEGNLVMNLHTDKVENVVIYRHLGIGKATFSRDMSSIRRKAHELLFGDEE
jgi:DNA-directed RNA polymerase specialized sigma24 family protein